jgi:hypothetical protein
MRSLTFLSIILFFTSTLFSQDDLWQKAVNIMANNQNWVAGKMVMEFKVVNKDDVADVHNVSTYKIYADENGDIQSDIVSMYTNGEDVTDKQKENLEKEREKAKNEKDEKDSQENRFAFNGKDEPFHPDNQAKVKITPIAGTKEINGAVCQGYEFSLPLEEHTKNGTLWLDIKTGAPVRQRFTTDPLPPKMKEMQTTADYIYPQEGVLQASQVSFEGVAGVLFIKRKIQGTMTFSDFWIHEEND